MYKDDPRFLPLPKTSEVRKKLVNAFPFAYWEDVAESISEKGFPCECVFTGYGEYGILQGFLFKNANDKLSFLLKLENVLQE